MEELNRIVSQKYTPRNVTISDPGPIRIDPKIVIDGPLYIQDGMVMCDKCGSIIKNSYFKLHRSSGACQRAVEKLEKET